MIETIDSISLADKLNKTIINKKGNDFVLKCMIQVNTSNEYRNLLKLDEKSIELSMGMSNDFEQAVRIFYLLLKWLN
jgi:uncharacterized pyridoxal phosphate-containing UPF0001 family protein